MRFYRLLLGTLAFLGCFGAVDALAAIGKVTFQVAFSGHLDCVTPFELENIPLTIKGTAVLNKDGSGKADMSMTAYYILTFKKSVSGQLGAPPVRFDDGGTGQVKVLKGNGLALILEYPNTRYSINVLVDDKKCGAEFVATTKNSKQIYDIYAAEAHFECNWFQIEKSSCKIK